MYLSERAEHCSRYVACSVGIHNFVELIGGGGADDGFVAWRYASFIAYAGSLVEPRNLRKRIAFLERDLNVVPVTTTIDLYIPRYNYSHLVCNNDCTKLSKFYW